MVIFFFKIWFYSCMKMHGAKCWTAFHLLQQRKNAWPLTNLQDSLISFNSLVHFVNNLCYYLVIVAVVASVNTTKREMEEMKSVEPWTHSMRESHTLALKHSQLVTTGNSSVLDFKPFWRWMLCWIDCDRFGIVYSRYSIWIIFDWIESNVRCQMDWN